MAEESSRFAARLKQLRGVAGLSQTELAAKAGINRSAVAKLEGGDREPNWSSVRQLAAALGVPISAFEDGAEDSAVKQWPGLAEVVKAWPRLPAHIRQSIRALVATVGSEEAPEESPASEGRSKPSGKKGRKRS
jgi:transcriptional regulator with XRE-family HTH domain